MLLLGILSFAAMKSIKAVFAALSTGGAVRRIFRASPCMPATWPGWMVPIGESIGADSRFLHLGMTSSDVLDTALALQLREAADLIVAELQRVREAAVKLALRHRRTLMAGRTHGVVAGRPHRD